MDKAAKENPAPKVDNPSDSGTTSDHDKTRTKPDGTTNPGEYHGYGSDKRPKEDAMYITTSDEYGWNPPNKDTYPTK